MRYCSTAIRSWVIRGAISQTRARVWEGVCILKKSFTRSAAWLVAALMTVAAVVTGMGAIPAGAQQASLEQPDNYTWLVNCVKPQSKQTASFGNTKTPGLSRFLSPEKWMLISATNCVWFSEPHDLQIVAAREIPEPIMGVSSSLSTVVHCEDASGEGSEQ